MAIANDGQPPLHVAGVSLGGADPGEFAVIGDGCSGVTLPAGARCTVTVGMRPAAAGALRDLAVTSDSAEGVAHIALGGTAVAAPAAAPADVTAPIVGATVRAQRLPTAVRGGLRATVSCTEPCTAALRLTLSRRLARPLSPGAAQRGGNARVRTTSVALLR